MQLFAHVHQMMFIMHGVAFYATILLYYSLNVLSAVVVALWQSVFFFLSKQYYIELAMFIQKYYLISGYQNIGKISCQCNTTYR